VWTEVVFAFDATTTTNFHFPKVMGLSLGQEIIAHALPRQLAYHYGADLKVVEKKIEKYRFDWSKFLDSDCAKSAMDR
jgi:hypothetical protein